MLKNLMMAAAALALSVTALSGAANATVFAFHAELSPSNEVGSSPLLTGSGFGRMLYNDRNTVGYAADDTYRLRIDFSGLGILDDPSTLLIDESASTIQLTQGHNHLGVRGVNGSVIQDLDAADSTFPPNETPLFTGGFLPVLGSLGDGGGLNFLKFLAPVPEQGAPTFIGTPIPGQALYTDEDIVANLLAYAYGPKSITNPFGYDDGRMPNMHGHLDTNWYVNLHTSISDGTGPLGTGHIRDQWQFTGIVVPEPASLALLGAGIMALGYFGKHRKA